ncbi:phosphatases II [Chiua virens]|nr:phosphatases II [Chiua virens]
MSLYLRRLVSGEKARFRDDNLNIELDLAYVTDKIIVMGFPAVGVESIYRNHRADVQRFLSARHHSDFWVFNFCPVRENAYPETVFGGRVSRYPFPDHHVPPFVYLSLVTREIHAWLSGSDSRVAVLHCKAGKGRSGTLACAYLLSRYAPPSTPVPRSLHESFSQWSLIGDKEGLQTPTTDTLPAAIDQKPASAGADLSRVSSEPTVNSLEQVLDLHTSRRMKPSLHPSRHHPDVPLAKKPKIGVSIPSQKRWLFYWSRVLVGRGPPSLRPRTGHPEHQVDEAPRSTKVKLTKLTVRMREPSRIQPHLVQAASVVITRAGKGRAVGEATSGRLWASLSRYTDRLVDELRHWENESWDPAGIIPTTTFQDDRWDKPKMIRSFARMGLSDTQSTDEDGSKKPIVTYVLRPVSEAEGEWIHVSVPESSLKDSQEGATTAEGSASMSLPVEEDDLEDLPDVLLDADRELRIKLFIGEVPLGWLWIIPAFHMSPDSPTSTVLLSNDEIDFAIGIGKALVDVKISLAWQTYSQDS